MAPPAEDLSLRKIAPLVVSVAAIVAGALFVTYWIARLSVTTGGYAICAVLQWFARRAGPRGSSGSTFGPAASARSSAAAAHALCYVAALSGLLAIALTFAADGSMTRAFASNAHFSGRVTPMDVSLAAYWWVDLILLSPVWLGILFYSHALARGWSGVVGTDGHNS